MTLTAEPAASPAASPLRALAFMSGAVASFSAMAVAGREMRLDLDTFEIMTYRSAIGFLLVAGFGLLTGRLAEIRTRRLRLHGLRNIVHFTAQNLWFFAVMTAPLAHVFALEFTTPIWVAVLAPLVLGEAMTRARVFAALLGFAGVLLVARPGMIPIGPGQIAAAVSAIGFAAMVLSTKRLTATETAFTILFHMTAMQLVFGLVCAGYDGDFALPETQNLGWVLVVGLGGLAAHFCYTSAMQCAPATVVAPMDFARLPVIAAIAALIYGEAIELAVFAGAALIFGGNLVNILSGRRRA